jgi:hypothetical protein
VRLLECACASWARSTGAGCRSPGAALASTAWCSIVWLPGAAHHQRGGGGPARLAWASPAPSGPGLSVAGRRKQLMPPVARHCAHHAPPPATSELARREVMFLSLPISRFPSPLWALIGLALRGKASAEAASMLPQASALLPCAGCVVGWRRGDRGSRKLLQPPKDFGCSLLV